MEDEKTLDEVEFKEPQEEEAEETVTLKKAEHDKLIEERDNYKKGLLAVKKAPKQVAEEPLTKGDFYRANEKQAIQLATTVSESDSEDSAELKKEIADNWDKIRVFYSGTSGRETVKDIHEDILDAHLVWKRRTGGSVKEPVVQETIAGTSGKGPIVKDNVKVIPKPVIGMEHWKTAK